MPVDRKVYSEIRVYATPELKNQIKSEAALNAKSLSDFMLWLYERYKEEKETSSQSAQAS